jgi:hypothetical protein
VGARPPPPPAFPAPTLCAKFRAGALHAGFAPPFAPVSTVSRRSAPFRAGYTPVNAPVYTPVFAARTVNFVSSNRGQTAVEPTRCRRPSRRNKSGGQTAVKQWSNRGRADQVPAAFPSQQIRWSNRGQTVVKPWSNRGRAAQVPAATGAFLLCAAACGAAGRGGLGGALTAGFLAFLAVNSAVIGGTPALPTAVVKQRSKWWSNTGQTLVKATVREQASTHNSPPFWSNSPPFSPGTAAPPHLTTICRYLTTMTNRRFV